MCFHSHVPFLFLDGCCSSADIQVTGWLIMWNNADFVVIFFEWEIYGNLQYFYADQNMTKRFCLTLVVNLWGCGFKTILADCVDLRSTGKPSILGWILTTDFVVGKHLQSFLPRKATNNHMLYIHVYCLKCHFLSLSAVCTKKVVTSKQILLTPQMRNWKMWTTWPFPVAAVGTWPSGGWRPEEWVPCCGRRRWNVGACKMCRWGWWGGMVGSSDDTAQTNAKKTYIALYRLYVMVNK